MIAEEALRLIELWASQGSTAFCATYLALEPLTGKAPPSRHRNRGDENLVSLDEIRQRLPGWVADAETCEESIALRPRGQSCRYIQLDDLGECDEKGGKVRPGDDPQAVAMRERLAPYALFALQTSWQSWQYWFAIPASDEKSDKAFATLLKRAAGANVPANGSVRCAGGLNFKAKHLTAEGYPLIRITQALGVSTTREQLASVLDFDPKPEAVLPQRASLQANGAQQWPDYAECYAYGIGRGDRDQGDVRFAQISAWRGFGVAAVASEILARSQKGAEQSDPERYALRKAEYGAELAAKYPNPTPFQGARRPQDTRHGAERPEILPPPSNALHGLAMASSGATAPTSPETAQPHARPAASSEPCLDQIFATEGAVGSRTLALVSSREDAVALHGATGIPAVAFGAAIPASMRARTALRQVIVATRHDEAGDALARRLIETCSLARLEYVPFPAESDEATLLALFSAFIVERSSLVEEATRELSAADEISAPSSLSEEPTLTETLGGSETCCLPLPSAKEEPSAGSLSVAKISVDPGRAAVPFQAFNAEIDPLVPSARASVAEINAVATQIRETMIPGMLTHEQFRLRSWHETRKNNG